MPARVQFGNVNLPAASYLVHAHADPTGTHPKIADVFVYVLAQQPNAIANPLADPTLLVNPRTLTLFWAGDASPTHEFSQIHLLQTISARRTQHSRMVLLKFGYAYNPAGTPGWSDGGARIAVHYPEAHNVPANYLTPVLPHPQGADHRFDVTGAQLAHAPGNAWQVSPGNRRVLAFDYSTASGIAALAGGTVPAPDRLALVSYRDNRCRVFNTLLEQDQQIRAGRPATPAAALSLTMPGQANAIPIPLANVAGTRLVYVEHRNFWPRAVWGGNPWDELLAPAQPVIGLPAVPSLGTIGDVVRLGADALVPNGQAGPPPDVGLEAVVLALGPGLSGQLAAVRA